LNCFIATCPSLLVSRQCVVYFVAAATVCARDKCSDPRLFVTAGGWQGGGHQLSGYFAFMNNVTADPTLWGAHMATTNRINRGAIPNRLDDLRCSWCLTCAETEPMRCAKCRLVFYCNRNCQKKHWKYHKHVCGTASKQWGELTSADTERKFFSDEDAEEEAARVRDARSSS